MKRFSHGLILILIALIALELAACGNASHGKQTAQGQSTQPSVTPGATTTQAGQTPTAAETSTPAEQIVLTLGKTQYTTSERIQVTITNHLTTPIYLSAYYTSCTYISMQRQTQSGWLSLGRCLTLAPQSAALQPGASVVQQLTPPVNNPKMAARALWPTGTYRALLYYSLTPDSDTTQGASVTSSTFSIR